MSVRVRYAPSPTGSPHVGNIRDALFKHLLSKHFGGVNILRIEDTDRNRLVPGAIEEIIESLQWLGIEWQEGFGKGGPHGPYLQSERQAAGIYEREIKKLLDSGAAYWAFDTPEELEEMRQFQQVNKQPIGYFGGEWRDASEAKREEARSKGLPGVIRLKVPRNQSISIKDFIRGRIEWDSNTVDDPVLIKADGMPTYHFAAMVDDHLMGITHIMRGEEWISSAPKHAVLFDAFGWERPVFVHCPVIKGSDGSKLSKRHGDTRCLDFRSAGYLPEALANFIALIGWSPKDDREVLSMEEMIEAFTLDGIQPAPGIFDAEKLKWLNSIRIRDLSPDQLLPTVSSFLSEGDTSAYWSATETHPDREETNKTLELLKNAIADTPEYVAETLKLEQERVKTLAEFGPASEFFFVETPHYEEKAVQKWFGKPHVLELFDAADAWLAGKSEVSTEDCEEFVRGMGAEKEEEWSLGGKLGPIVHPLRVAFTGKTAGPGLFELMALLGPERMSHRLATARNHLFTQEG
jgi:glutamyl-tRNA synthetase